MKSDLLVTALTRGNAYLQMTIEEALVGSRTSRDALAKIIEPDARFAFRYSHVVVILLTETRNLPEQHAVLLVQAQRDYIDEWVHLAQGLDTVRAVAELRIAVHAILTIINNLARTPHLVREGWCDLAANRHADIGRPLSAIVTAPRPTRAAISKPIDRQDRQEGEHGHHCLGMQSIERMMTLLATKRART